DGPEAVERNGARELRDPHPGLEAEFEAIYKREFPLALRLARRRLKDDDAAEDVVQTVFLRIWEGYASTPALVFRPDPQATRAFILRAVHNELKTLWRRARLVAQKVVYVRDEMVNTLYHAHARERPRGELDLSEAVELALAKIPVRQVEAFRLVRFDDLSYAEAAAVMGISRETVKKLLANANFRLRGLLLSYAIPDPDWSFIYRDDVRSGRKDAQP
ncbi:MAG TPA: RNA polymerase sigma factor, partial [Gemmatimonadaceae bacterium]